MCIRDRRQCVARCLTVGPGNSKAYRPAPEVGRRSTMCDTKPSAWRRRERSRDLTGLGWLEADVLRVVWDNGDVTVRDVYERLRDNRRIAYTTVMSVLRNLCLLYTSDAAYEEE